MNQKVIPVVSWLIALWTCFVFLSSLPYKFTGHPVTQHIFETVGDWLGGFLGSGIGNLFGNVGGYLVGSFELLTSLVLLVPAFLWLMNKIGQNKVFSRAKFHRIGGLMAATIMAGAAFFHIFTPLGIEVVRDGQSDGGSLFRSAISVLIGGIILFLINRRAPQAKLD